MGLGDGGGGGALMCMGLFVCFESVFGGVRIGIGIGEQGLLEAVGMY